MNAEFERELIQERIRSGIAAAKARGKKLGRQPKSDGLVTKGADVHRPRARQPPDRPRTRTEQEQRRRAMVGRWIGHIPAGRFVQDNIGKAAPVPGEHAIGWIVHYVIGTAYGFLLVALLGVEWIRQPTLLPPMILALVLLAAPYFVMMPGMGAGIAGAKTPEPNGTRLKSVIGHSVFGLRMYVTALAAEVGFGNALAAFA